MTKEDIQIVEEYSHLKHFVFDLVRCIDEGVPVASYFACTDKNSGSVDTALLNAQKYVADSIQKRVFFGGVSECKFKVGDTVVLRDAPERGKKRIKEFVDVVIGDVDENGVFCMSYGVAIEGFGHTRIFPISYVNKNFELAE